MPSVRARSLKQGAEMNLPRESEREGGLGWSSQRKLSGSSQRSRKKARSIEKRVCQEGGSDQQFQIWRRDQ